MELFKLVGSIFIEDNDAEKKIDSIDKKGEGLASKLGSLAGSAATAGLAFGAMGAAAVGGLAVKGVMAAEELQKALNGFQAATGRSEAAMKNMGGAMEEIYANNFGESFEDIGKSMVEMEAGMIGADEDIVAMTQHGLALRDTFEMEVGMSAKAAGIMIANFGDTGDEAFNLIAQGAQAGLNANGDLSEIIAEYAPHFAKAGLSSEQMINMLVSGAQEGVFSVDQMSDAIKEFGIRSKDGSKTSAEGFQALGMDAEKATAAFAKGGKDASDSFAMVTKRISEMKDPVKQYNTGVALFGTMWEEVQSKGMIAMLKTEGGINKNTDALKQINAVKYNTFGEAMVGIGRQLEVGIMIPLGQKILPILSQFATWVNANMPQIKEVISNVMGGIGGALTSTGGIVQTTLIPAFTQFWAWLQPNLPMIQQTFQTVFASVGSFISFVVTNVLPPFITLLTFIMTNVVPALANQFAIWFPKILDLIKELWIVAKPVIDSLVTGFKNAWPVIKFVLDIIGVNISILLTTLKGMIMFISGVLTGDWSRAWNGIKTIFVGVWNAIYSQFKNIIDPIANKIKWLKDAFGGFMSKVTSFKMPSFSIPGFATGGIVTRPTLAMVGEGSEAEAILPLSKLNKLMNSGNGKGNISFNITGNYIQSDYDVERIMDIAMKRLRYEGVY